MRLAERYRTLGTFSGTAYAAKGEHWRCDGYWLWHWQSCLHLRRLWHWPRAETVVGPAAVRTLAVVVLGSRVPATASAGPVARGTLAPGTLATASATAAEGTRGRMVLRPGTPVEATAVVRAEVVTVETVAATVEATADTTEAPTVAVMVRVVVTRAAAIQAAARAARTAAE